MKPYFIQLLKDGRTPIHLNMMNVVSMEIDTIGRKTATILTFSNSESYRVGESVPEILEMMETAQQNFSCLS